MKKDKFIWELVFLIVLAIILTLLKLNIFYYILNKQVWIS